MLVAEQALGMLACACFGTHPRDSRHCFYFKRFPVFHLYLGSGLTIAKES